MSATAQVHVALRFFVALALTSRLPVPSWLAQLRRRWGVERPQALCDQRVTHARAPGWVRDRLRLQDATQVLATIAVPSPLGLVAQSRQRRLEAARP